VVTIRESAQDHAAKTNKFTAQPILKMSGIILSTQFRSARVKTNKVSIWNLYQSDVKEDIPEHIQYPAKTDGNRPKFTRDYAKAVM